MTDEKINDVLGKIAEENDLRFSESFPLTGGDINEVFVLKGNEEKFVVKINDADKYPGMFEAEKLGLEKLLEPDKIDVPKPFKNGIIDNKSYLLLEHKESAPMHPDFWKIFGEKLAKLHQVSADQFGLEKNNYIGSLPQYNENKTSASEFYIEMRLKPQLKMAEVNGFKLKINDSFFKNIKNEIPDEKPSLIHGDLWNGNFIINKEGEPCLIDPATAYAPREMDIGMMHLFGGFNDELFNRYNEVFPLENGWKDRIPLWELYYLLVHLNIFGGAYKSQVTSIISHYS
ncbi:fructosamine kinase [Christiangramia fulva]|uniref:Fructosamine kinase n=1 Tax=Christiangramia fulva TaxID=2126553 RepID=A0A2R3Z5A8_9FLAO|nr:fructosamine kinase family protein [Christiangramia fulva]AVR45451.1 fructosamine kinase [Christiangramia fulva]